MKKLEWSIYKHLKHLNNNIYIHIIFNTNIKFIMFLILKIIYNYNI